MKKSLLFLVIILCFQSIRAQDDSFFDLSKIQEIKLTFEQEDWQHDLDSLRYNGANLLLGSAEINGERYQNIGVRWKGSRSFKPGSKRNGIHIELDYINRSQKIEGHKIVELSNALRDPSMVREVLSYNIARKYMPAPRANYARVWINDEWYGLFVNVEAIDDVFLTENYGIQITFASWMLVGVPVMLVMLPLAWISLTRWSLSTASTPT